VQNDIKRVIAYSTCSQLGYMFVALGVGAYGIAIFHLFTHAFFKALCSSAPVRSSMPCPTSRTCATWAAWKPILKVTYWMMLIGTLALTGVGIPVHRRLLLQGRHHRKRLRGAQWRRADNGLLAAGHRGSVHLVLFVAPDVHDLPRQAARQPRRDEPRA
jgi:hypothetical protein